VAAKPALRDCIEAALSQSDRLMSAVLAGLRGLQGMQKGRAAAINQNPGSRHALDVLLAQEAAVKASFLAELRGACYSRRAQDTVVQPILRFDDFQFLDETQIDANIESALTQQEIAQAVEDVLPTFSALVSNLMGLVTVQTQLNPLKPEAFVQALRACMAEHVPDDGARRALLSAAASLMGPELHKLYKELFNWLRSQGIEPALPVGYVPGSPGVSGAKPVENAVSRTLLTLDRLRKLLTTDIEFTFGQTGGPKDFLHTVPASYVALEDLKLVEPMMQRLAKRAAQTPTASVTLPSATVDMLANDEPQSRKLGRQLGSEVVRLMVENLGKDERLLPKVRQILKDLEPVLLQLSQADPRFFSERQHPARQLLDRITNRSLAFKTEQDDGFPRFAKAVSNAVQVLGGGPGDATSFARALRKLEDGWEREEAAQRKRQQEAARALLHAEQRNLLAHKFAEDFVQRLEHKDVPEFVQAFLRGPWAQVMAESQLQSADGVSDPHGFSQIVDDLIWSVQLRLIRKQRSKLVKMVPTLLVKLRQGLQLVDYPEERIPILFDHLIALHEQAFEGSPGGAQGSADTTDSVLSGGDSRLPQDSAFDAPVSEVVWVGEEEGSESGYVGADAESLIDYSGLQADASRDEAGPWTVADLKVGTWVELMLQGAWVRAQLTWASPHLTLFMFVSGKGLAHSMSRRTMDQRRAQGLIRVVSDGDVIGSALDGVAQVALRNEPVQPLADSAPAPLN
jgi:hypothetical protein